MNYIKAKKISKKYAGFELKELSFELEKGELLAFLDQTAQGKQHS